MAYQIALTDEDFTRLQAVSSESGKPIETLVHEAITQQFAPRKTIGTYIMPTGEPDTPEEEAEDEELALAFDHKHPWPSEMIIEDRGPR